MAWIATKVLKKWLCIYCTKLIFDLCICGLYKHPVPFWGPWPDCRGQAGRHDPWLPAEDDLSPRPAAASGSGGHRRGPGTETHCRLAAVLARRERDRQDKETNKEINESRHMFHNAPSSIGLQYIGKKKKKHLSRIKMSRWIYSLQLTHAEIPKTSTGFPLQEKKRVLAWLEAA